jgi:regulator of MON1-CCZ1 complex
MLEQGKVIDALRLANKSQISDSLPARKYLEAALKTNDPLVFHSVFVFFQQKNLRTRGISDFMQSK